MSIHILALLAVLIQCSPLRTCAFQDLLAGSSCHDDEQDVVADASRVLATDGCVPHPRDGHDEHCICERPKSTATPTTPAAFAAGAHLPTFGAESLVIASPGIPQFTLHHTAFESPPPSVGNRLPLLT
jgi:hypothetical protein